MFDTSLLLLLKALIVNILVPLIPGLFAMRLFTGVKFKGAILYILARFLGVGVVAHWMFDLQFIHFGIGIGEYLLLLLLLIFSLGIKIWKFNLSIVDFKDTLYCDMGFSLVHEGLNRFEKIFTAIGFIFVGWFIINSFIHTTSFPSYADDTFGNRHKPAINIYYDGGVKMFGSTGEVLGRARLGYPIHIPIYKSVITDMMGGWYEVYMNLFQWIGFILILILSFILTYRKNKNIFHSIVPSIIICGLPLVFRHVIDGYYELPSVYYTIIASWLLYEYLVSHDTKYIVLGSFFLRILAFVKNDGFVVYAPGVIISFIIVWLLSKDIRKQVSELINLTSISQIIGGFMLLLLPFLLIKQYYNLGFNQAQGDQSGVGISQTIHREIFNQFKVIFFTENNYNIVLIFIVILLWGGYVSYSKKKWDVFYLILLPVVIFLIFTAVFLLTENYKFVMDQTTVNRTYMACFMIAAFYSGIIIDYVQSIIGQETSKIRTKNR